MQLNNTFTL